MGADDDASKAAAALARQVAALDRAGRDASTAAEHARRTVGQAQRAGFARVAEGMDHVRRRLARLADLLSAASDQGTPGITAAAAAPDQASPRHAAAELAITAKAVDGMRTVIVNAVQETRDLENQVGPLLAGAQPGPLLGILRAVRQALFEAAQHGDAAKQHAYDAIARGEQIGAMAAGGSAGGAGSGAAATTGTNPDASGTRPEPAPFHRRVMDGLPQRPGGRGSTTGVLTATDGTKLADVRSGRRGPGEGAPGLHGRTALLEGARQHAEGHAAALLRRADAPSEATLYVNNTPCPGPYGCRNTLAWQLPKGATLTVYWPDGHKVFHGDGRGMS